MKFINGKSICALGFLTIASYASAGNPIGDVATATANLVFSAGGVASVSITPVTNLYAGQIAQDTKVADFTVANSLADGAVAYRWTPASGAISESDPSVNVVTGSSGKDFSLQLSTIGTTLETGWYRPTTSVNTMTRTVTSQALQQVDPGNYTLSIDATVWQY